MVQQLPWSVLPIDRWPESDHAAWMSAITPASIFDSRRSLDNRPPEQILILRAAWGRWLGYLQYQNIDIEAGGYTHLERKVIGQFVNLQMQHLSRVTVRSYMTTLLIVAEHMFSADTLVHLKSVARRVQKEISPVGDHQPELIDTVTLDKIADRMLDDAGLIKGTYKKAGLYRDALAIKMLIYTPLRIGNLGALRIGKEITKIGQQFRILIPGKAAKARRSLAYPIPATLTPPIEVYLATHRPYLLECRGRHWQPVTDNAFWISRDGGSQKARTLSRHIADLTEQYLGERVPPHRFRNIATSSITVMAPDKVNLIKSVLGHSTLAMSERHYNRAGTIEAGLAFQAVING